VSIARWDLKEAGLRDEKFPMGKVPSRRTEIAYKADLGRTTLQDKRNSNTTRIPYSKCGGCGMKVIVLTRGDLQGMLPTSHRSKPCRKVAVELAEVAPSYPIAFSFDFPFKISACKRQMVKLFRSGMNKSVRYVPIFQNGTFFDNTDFYYVTAQ